MRRPKLIIGYTTALAFILAGCAINIEPTDLSVVTVDKDRTVIEKALGKPDEVVEAQGFTIASYSYNKGIFVPAPRGGGGSSGGGPGGYAAVGALVLAPIAYAIRTSKASARQKGHLATIFDTDGKLLFAGSLDEPTSEKLTSIAIRYQEAQSGDAGALIDLSEFTLIPDQKRTFLETAANSGSAKAQYRVANSATNDAAKIGLLRKAAAQNHTSAQIDLGKLLLYGSSEFVDRTEAKVWLTKAADAGESEAQTELSKLSSFETKLIRAERGEPEAQYALGNAYEIGEAVKPNPEEALNWWLKAAEAGYAPAQAKYGDRVYSDPVAKLKWHRLAAEQGYAPSQTEIGKRYLGGNGTERDREQAKLWLAKAAESGDEAAIKSLEKIALNENWVRKQRVTAQQGDAYSQRHLGQAYHFGEGVEYDIKKAVRWYERAAVGGDGDAQYMLGSLYQFGHEIETDLVEAFKWYTIAESNLTTAKFRKLQLSEKLTLDQIAEAERKAREWLEAHPQ